MKKTIEEHAARFDEMATEYDDKQESEEYRAAASLVVEHASSESDDTVLDLGMGTGAIALALAPDAKRVLGRDISSGMLDQAQAKADEAGIENVEFEEGSFREPNVAEPVDIVVSNFAMHHLGNDEKREAIDAIAKLGPRKFVLGDVMFFGESNPDDPFCSPEVDDPATVGVLADALTDARFSLTAVERIHEQVGVLVAERPPLDDTNAIRESNADDETNQE
ncbi:MAG TPA: class I SAM-dependent methyltransferase [Halococcus sp.]|nr:class I SAM-dependent methyltransferase [Halococcus sp.]